MPKIITTGQGGCLVTNNDELGKKIRLLKDFGRTGGGCDVHNEFGINCKFTELQAIVGLSQMRTIDKRIEAKKRIYNLYYQELKGISDIEFLDTNIEYVTPWFVDIYTYSRTKLIEHLKKSEIETRPIYSPINKQLCYREHFQHNIDFLSTEHYAKKGLWLPSSMSLKDEDILFICSKIKEFYK
jgi:perosamine synthetase